MTKRQIKVNRRAPRRLVLFGWAVVGVLAYALGLYAAPSKKVDPKKEVFDDLVRAVERAVEPTKEMARDATPDAGAVDHAQKKQAPIGFAPSPEPEEAPDAGLPAYRRLPAPDKAGGADKQVLILEVHDIIDMGLSAYLERAIEEHPDAAALILDINTPGGRVDAATLMRDAIMAAPKSMRTVAFIHPRAISAGAFISLACDLIFIADGGSMGAATPISLGGGGETQPVEEKMVSYFRTEMATTARAKGRRGDIAEAMVDAEVEIKDISPAGKLLTLDTAGALRYELADAKANNLHEVLSLLALGGAKQVKLNLNWAERLARLFTHPILSGILMSIGVLGILIELYHPGFGLPGIVGITCLIIFFAGHLVVNLAGWEEVLLFVLGLGLLIAEVFVTPGFGLLGAAGIIAVVISLVLAMTSMPVSVSFSTGYLTSSLLRVMLSLGGAVLLFFGALALLPKTGAQSRLVLEAAIKATASGGREGEVIQAVLASGETGIADSFLRPAGIARFGNRRVDVVSEGDFIERGEAVKIVRVSGNHVVVRKLG